MFCLFRLFEKKDTGMHAARVTRPRSLELFVVTGYTEYIALVDDNSKLNFFENYGARDTCILCRWKDLAETCHSIDVFFRQCRVLFLKRSIGV